MAFLLYNDGIQTIIKMASIYGNEIGIDRDALIEALDSGRLGGVGPDRDRHQADHARPLRDRQ